MQNIEYFILYHIAELMCVFEAFNCTSFGDWILKAVLDLAVLCI